MAFSRFFPRFFGCDPDVLQARAIEIGEGFSRARAPFPECHGRCKCDCPLRDKRKRLCRRGLSKLRELQGGRP